MGEAELFVGCDPEPDPAADFPLKAPRSCVEDPKFSRPAASAVSQGVTFEFGVLFERLCLALGL